MLSKRNDMRANQVERKRLDMLAIMGTPPGYRTTAIRRISPLQGATREGLVSAQCFRQACLLWLSRPVEYHA
jgi:hypothetical protein